MAHEISVLVQPLPASVHLRSGVSDFNYDREPNVDERNKLSRDIYRVEDSQLAEAVQLLEQRCPDAVVRVSREHSGQLL